MCVCVLYEYRFYDNVIVKERRRALRFRHMLSYDLDNFEYLCPYCKALSNTVIPIVPHLHTLTSRCVIPTGTV